MPKNEVNDPITHQEMAFALLALSGNMTDERAAEAVGLNPANAAYIKSKSCVRAFMLEQRALMQQQIVEQETGLSRLAVEGLRPLNPSREQVLGRLWEFANMGPEVTRGSITGQVKALSMIVAIEGLIPDRRAGSVDKNPASPPSKPQIYLRVASRTAGEIHRLPAQPGRPGRRWAWRFPGRARSRFRGRRVSGPRPYL